MGIKHGQNPVLNYETVALPLSYIGLHNRINRHSRLQGFDSRIRFTRNNSFFAVKSTLFPSGTIPLNPTHGQTGLNDFNAAFTPVTSAFTRTGNGKSDGASSVQPSRDLFIIK